MRKILSLLVVSITIFANADQSNDDTIGQEVLELVAQKESEQFDELVRTFRTRWLDKYYLSESVLSKQLLSRLNITELEAVVSVLTTVFDSKAWYYFVDKKEAFNGLFVKRIISELSGYIIFLNQGCIDPFTGKPVTSNDKDSTTILNYWIKSGKQDIAYGLYALLVDYHFVSLYSLVIRASVDRAVFSQFNSIYVKIEGLLRSLSGSKYEYYYQEKLKVAQRISKKIEARCMKNSPMNQGI